MKDYYYILGISQDSTQREIRKAYRKLSFKYHPDYNKDDKFFEERFKEIREAYETLGDTESRRKYDREYTRGDKSDQSEAPEKPIIHEFSLSKHSAKVGEEVKVKWATSHASTVRLNLFGDVKTSGERVIRFSKPKENVVFTLIATNKHYPASQQSIKLSVFDKLLKDEKVEKKNSVNKFLYFLFGFLIISIFLFKTWDNNKDLDSQNTKNQVSNEDKRILNKIPEIQKARVEAKKLGIPYELVELIDHNGWDWSVIKESYKLCEDHPLLEAEVGITTNDIERLCVCQITKKVKAFEYENDVLIGSTYENIGEITSKCMNSTGIRQKINRHAGIEPNYGQINNDVDDRPIRHMYGNNGWSENFLKPLYAGVLSNQSVKNMFIEAGFTSNEYKIYAICLTEKVSKRLKPESMVANPKSFKDKMQMYAEECVDDLH